MMRVFTKKMLNSVEIYSMEEIGAKIRGEYVEDDWYICNVTVPSVEIAKKCVKIANNA